METRDRLLTSWNINSWKSKDIAQSVDYSSKADFYKVYQQLTTAEPLISLDEILSLQDKIAAVNSAKAILLQAGDCAESFNTNIDYTVKQAKFILLLSSLLQAEQNQKVISIGRIAGQYAKPRSSEIEIKDGLTLLSYRGDIINNIKFDKYSRDPDPILMLQAYEHSQHNLAAMQTQLKSNLYISHESLHLPYESALTRKVHTGDWYNLSAHFLWVGIRTSHLNSAHLEYVRGINNPIGIKISANDSIEKIITLLNYLNPHNIPGRITLIYRFGYQEISNYLPKMLREINKTGQHVIWMIDPMHGNTILSKKGVKTRYYNEILDELEYAKLTHKKLGILLGGLHLEVTHEEVTECVGGPEQLTENDLKENYKTLVDPRLNYSQAVALIKEYNKL